MAKISINAAPTFDLAVDIPVPGKGVASVVFTFKHRTKDQLSAFFAANQATVDGGGNVDELEQTMLIASGWELDDSFNRENVSTFLQSYPGSAVALVLAYTGELQRFKLGN